MATQRKLPKRPKTCLERDYVSDLIRNGSERVSYTLASKLSQFKDLMRVVVDNRDSDCVICKKCDDWKIIKHESKNGTAPLTNHINQNHKSDMEPSSAQKQSRMESYTRRTVPKTENSRIADSAAICCALDFRPMFMIEGEGMLRLAQTLINVGAKCGKVDTAGVLPSADTVTRHLHNIYDSTREKVVEHFKVVDFVNITTDHWTNKYSGHSYMSISAIYLQLTDPMEPKELKMMNRVIGTFGVNDKKSNTTIDKFLEQLEAFDIKSKLRIIVTDNAKNMSSAFKTYHWVGCTAHNLSLLQKYSFGMDKKSKAYPPIPAIKTLVEATKSMVEKVKKGSINTQLESRLKQQVESRWDTYYDMFESVLENYESLKKFPSIITLLNTPTARLHMLRKQRSRCILLGRTSRFI